MESMARYNDCAGKVFSDKLLGSYQGEKLGNSTDPHYQGSAIIRFIDGLIDSGDYNIPAIECADAHKEYWTKGVRHRPRSIGPAVVSNTETGLTRNEYWENGILISMEEV